MTAHHINSVQSVRLDVFRELAHQYVTEGNRPRTTDELIADTLRISAAILTGKDSESAEDGAA